jgi:exonuclease III
VATCPFFQDYHGAWWNVQALFASDPMLQHHKQSHAWKILNKVNFMGFAETHSTDGHARACSLPQNTKFFWSHGPSRHQAGVGLAIKHDFLQNFNPARDDDWDEIELRRVARLPLRGPNGSLDLYVCYFPTGTLTEEQAHKTALINNLQAGIRSHHNTLSILMGDWNFVMKKSDRLCLRTMQNTGDHDKTTAQRFDLLLDAHHLHELDQPTFTHTNTTAHSKIDRIYTNHHVAEQLDRQFTATTLAPTRLSTHRPISFPRTTKPKDDDPQSQGPFPTYILHHKDFSSVTYSLTTKKG